MSEPEAGTALTDLTTTGTLRNGQVVLRGTKRWRMRDTRQFTAGGDLPLVRRGALGAGSAVAGLR